MEYKRLDVGLKIYREALARFTEFSNQRLGVYTPYAHENSNQSLNNHLEDTSVSVLFTNLMPKITYTEIYLFLKYYFTF